MVPKGTVLQRTAANCRLTHHVSAMADVLTSPVSTAACLGASGGRFEPLAAAAQSKDWQKRRLPQSPPWVSCASGAQTTRGLAAA